MKTRAKASKTDEKGSSSAPETSTPAPEAPPVKAPPAAPAAPETPAVEPPQAVTPEPEVSTAEPPPQTTPAEPEPPAVEPPQAAPVAPPSKPGITVKGVGPAARDAKGPGITVKGQAPRARSLPSASSIGGIQVHQFGEPRAPRARKRASAAPAAPPAPPRPSAEPPPGVVAHADARDALRSAREGVIYALDSTPSDHPSRAAVEGLLFHLVKLTGAPKTPE